MGTYKGSLRVAATADVIEAVFEVSEESLRVSTGRQVLGTWALPDVTAEPRPDGIHVSLDGENVIVTVPDPESFTSALAPRRRRPKGRREKKRAQGRLRKRPVQPPAPESEAVAVRPEPAQPRIEPAPAQAESPQPRIEPAPAQAKSPQPRPEPGPPTETVVAAESRTKQRRSRDIMNLVRQIPELFDPENWAEWLQDPVIRWSIASVGVIVLALLVLFAANTLGMILVLLGMVALIIAALAASDDLSAYRAIPGALSETGLVIAGAVAMVIGALLILIG